MNCSKLKIGSQFKDQITKALILLITDRVRSKQVIAKLVSYIITK